MRRFGAAGGGGLHGAAYVTGGFAVPHAVPRAWITVEGMSDAPLSATPLPRVAPVLPPWPGEALAVRGGEVFVRHTPWTGPVDPPDDGAAPRERALYVHGLGGASTNWTDLAALLAVRFDGWALDLPGFGRSRPPLRGRYSIRGHVAAVIDVLEHIVQLPGDAAGEPVHLLGNSLGGLVSLLVASRRPDLVASLTLISPAMPVYRVPPAFSRAMVLLLLPGVPTLAERRMAGIAPEDARAADDPDVLRGPGAGAARAGRAGRPGDARAGGPAVGRPGTDPQHARADHLLPAGGPGQRVAGGPRRCGRPPWCCGAAGTSSSTRRSRRGSPPPSPTPGC